MGRGKLVSMLTPEDVSAILRSYNVKTIFLHILLIISGCFLLKFLHIAALILALALLSSAQQYG